MISKAKRHELTEQFIKHNSSFCCIQRTYLIIKDGTYLRVKGWKTAFQANRPKKEASIAIQQKQHTHNHRVDQAGWVGSTLFDGAAPITTITETKHFYCFLHMQRIYIVSVGNLCRWPVSGCKHLLGGSNSCQFLYTPRQFIPAHTISILIKIRRRLCQFPRLTLARQSPEADDLVLDMTRPCQIINSHSRLHLLFLHLFNIEVYVVDHSKK